MIIRIIIIITNNNLWLCVMYSLSYKVYLARFWHHMTFFLSLDWFFYYNSDTPVKPPRVSVYQSTGADLKGRRSLLCVATDMVPSLARVSWRRRGGGGEEGEQLELRDAASILAIDQETLSDQYICRVEHESGLKEVAIPAGNEETLTLWSMTHTGYHLEHSVCY